MNTFGRILRTSSWGTSHGAGIGVLIDGLPAGLKYNEELLQNRLKQRQGGGLGTPRKEPDIPELLSGVENGYTTGDPIALLVRNSNTRSSDYDDIFRPAHADFTYRAKFARALGAGGGRASARESLAKVIAGAFAAMFLEHFNVRAYAALCGVGECVLDGFCFSEEDFLAAQAAANSGICALGGEQFIAAAISQIKNAQKSGDSVGASVAAAVFGAPAGLGEVLYDKLDARIAQYLMGLNAVKAVEFGAGSQLAIMHASSANDEILAAQATPSQVLPRHDFGVRRTHSTTAKSQPNSPIYRTAHNYAGGVLGGLSTSESICVKAHFKPTPSIAKEQVLALPNGELFRGSLRGRHDPCVGVRAAIIVRSLIELAVADFMLLNASARMDYLESIYK